MRKKLILLLLIGASIFLIAGRCTPPTNADLQEIADLDPEDWGYPAGCDFFLTGDSNKPVDVSCGSFTSSVGDGSRESDCKDRQETARERKAQGLHLSIYEKYLDVDCEEEHNGRENKLCDPEFRQGKSIPSFCFE